MRNAIVAYLRKVPGIRYAVTKEELFTVASELPFIELVRRGFHPKRSGDVIFHLEPAWLPEPTFASGGTTHGSPYSYDTHVPLVWYGWNVPKGKTYHPVSITDIAPTLAAMLRIMVPNGCTGKVIVPLLER